MKTLRLIGMAIVAIIMSVNFAACSDDDEDIDVSQLEGTWGLVRSAGWALCSEETEREECDESYDPYNPDGGCAKLIIKKLADNSYSVTDYVPSSSSQGQWNEIFGSQIWTLNSNTLTITQTDKIPGYFEDDVIKPVIEILTADKLVLRVKYDNVQIDEHPHSADYTDTFVRMK